MDNVKICIDDLLSELSDSEKELKRLRNDAEDLQSSISDAFDNLTRIINMIENGTFNEEPEPDSEN